MIGKIMTGKSFRGCISYCLEDKQHLSPGDNAVKNRAEVLCHNLCYGNKSELIKQFKEVQSLNPRLSKPVMHVTLSFPPGEQIDRNTMLKIVEDCAKDLGFDDHQYLAVLHNDTRHKHIHIVVNKIGFDGKTLSDSNNYRKMANHCRKMEEKYKLTPVLSPGKFMPVGQRGKIRLDARKELLKACIKECLRQRTTYEEFEKRMNVKGYRVIKGRGISFLDVKKVKVKGSEVGYSLKTIEKIISHELGNKTKVTADKAQQKVNSEIVENKIKSATEPGYTDLHRQKEQKPPNSEDFTNPNFLRKRKRRRLRMS